MRTFLSSAALGQLRFFFGMGAGREVSLAVAARIIAPRSFFACIALRGQQTRRGFPRRFSMAAETFRAVQNLLAQVVSERMHGKDRVGNGCEQGHWV
jgi:hypothetical protein